MNESVETYLKYARDVNEPHDVVSRSSIIFNVKCVKDAQLLIDRGAHLNMKNEDGKTPLFYIEDSELFKFLVSKGASINIRDRNGCNLFFYKKNIEIIKFLLDNGLDPNTPNKWGETAMHCVSSPEVVDLFMRCGYKFKNADPFFFIKDPVIISHMLRYYSEIPINKYNETPLFYTGNSKIIDLFKTHINHRNNEGKTILHYASDLDLIKLFIDNGADPSIEDRQGLSPIFSTNKEEIIRLFISKDNNIVNCLNGNKETILFNEELHLPLIKFIVSEGANILQQNRDGKTILFTVKDPEIAEYYAKMAPKILSIKDIWKRHAVFYYQNIDMLRWFVSKGVDLNKKDHSGMTPVFKSKTIEELKLFVENGANTDIITNENRTLLFWINDLESAKFLVEKYEIDPHHLDNEERNVLYYISNPDLVRYYITKGVDFNHKDSRRQTFLDYNNKLSNTDKHIFKRVIHELMKNNDTSEESDSDSCEIDTFNQKDPLSLE